MHKFDLNEMSWIVVIRVALELKFTVNSFDLIKIKDFGVHIGDAKLNMV